MLLLFNLLAEFQRAAGLPVYREPATIRTQILTCGAILGRAGRRAVLHLSENWGGLTSENPFAGQHLALANSNFAEVAARVGPLTSRSHYPTQKIAISGSRSTFNFGI